MPPTENGDRFAALEARVHNSEIRLMEAERSIRSGRLKLRVTWAVSTLSAIAMFAIGWHKDALAQGYGITLAQAATRIAALETKTASLSVVAANDSSNTSGQQTVRFSGVNVQIVDGSGATTGTQSGLGNLIIGYNEKRGNGGDTRTGNHNLVAGISNSYSGNGGVVFGFQNSISSAEASVLGGYNNTASGVSSSVSGGYNNKAIGSYSSVLGGASNMASGDYTSVQGGQTNVASGFGSSVSGGNQNTASGQYSSVSGGVSNTASGGYSTVSGGPSRMVSTDSGWVAGRFTGTSYTGYFNSP